MPIIARKRDKVRKNIEVINKCKNRVLRYIPAKREEIDNEVQTYSVGKIRASESLLRNDIPLKKVGQIPYLQQEKNLNKS